LKTTTISKQFEIIKTQAFYSTILGILAGEEKATTVFQN
jgi:hypothetical protein